MVHRTDVLALALHLLTSVLIAFIPYQSKVSVLRALSVEIMTRFPVEGETMSGWRVYRKSFYLSFSFSLRTDSVLFISTHSLSEKKKSFDWVWHLIDSSCSNTETVCVCTCYHVHVAANSQQPGWYRSYQTGSMEKRTSVLNGITTEHLVLNCQLQPGHTQGDRDRRSSKVQHDELWFPSQWSLSHMTSGWHLAGFQKVDVWIRTAVNI